jgi:hypothetical protein
MAEIACRGGAPKPCVSGACLVWVCLVWLVFVCVWSRLLCVLHPVWPRLLRLSAPMLSSVSLSVNLYYVSVRCLMSPMFVMTFECLQIFF